MIRAAIYDGSPCDHPSRLGAGSACFPSLDYESFGRKPTCGGAAKDLQQIAIAAVRGRRSDTLAVIGPSAETGRSLLRA